MTLRAGDRVRVCRGSFRGLTGIVTRTHDGAGMLQVNLGAGRYADLYSTEVEWIGGMNEPTSVDVRVEARHLYAVIEDCRNLGYGVNLEVVRLRPPAAGAEIELTYGAFNVDELPESVGPYKEGGRLIAYVAAQLVARRVGVLAIRRMPGHD
jgi:KOW motif